MQRVLFNTLRIESCHLIVNYLGYTHMNQFLSVKLPLLLVQVLTERRLDIGTHIWDVPTVGIESRGDDTEC